MHCKKKKEKKLEFYIKMRISIIACYKTCRTNLLEGRATRKDDKFQILPNFKLSIRWARKWSTRVNHVWPDPISGIIFGSFLKFVWIKERFLAGFYHFGILSTFQESLALLPVAINSSFDRLTSQALTFHFFKKENP